ncbi:hypothetical protein P3T27_006530 [Kitasatospora sp. MAA19]|uniref:hypothetical protein n=1 Tax=Kitasatospora sp. MAA19 TaxID=3035090 RepID=UPI0024767406|nr:hypothetical protein [Kitasatospora sp. MAA19]MDH6709781.1 hypothetical protein [Kitasatospora sp. MAA19]
MTARAPLTPVNAARNPRAAQPPETTVDHTQLTGVIETALERIETEVGIEEMEIPDLAAILRAKPTDSTA